MGQGGFSVGDESNEHQLEDRLRRVEDTLEELRATGAKLHTAHLRLVWWSAEKAASNETALVRARISNYGKGTARDVRFWVETREGEIGTTIGGGAGATIGRNEHLDLDATELPDWVEVSAPGYARVTWRDATGEHDLRRRRIW